MALKAATTVFGLMRPHIPEAIDGILTSAGICEGFAGAGVSSSVLLFAGFAGLVAGTLAMGAVEYSKLQAAHDALAAHAEAEYGIRSASLASPLRDALAVSAAFAAGAVLPWLAIVVIPGPGRRTKPERGGRRLVG